MVDGRKMLYDIMYSLAARDGRERTLFGSCAQGARQAFHRSLAGRSFPELWFEIPLKGEPWFDLHALTSRDDVSHEMAFTPYETGGYPDEFAWFASQGSNVRQLALSWDVSSGSIETPALQLLVADKSPKTACDFLEASGKADAVEAYQAFANRLPEGWFACYVGVFPHRPGHFLRVECIPERDLQAAYSKDGDLIRRDLEKIGMDDAGEDIVAECKRFAGYPFQIEFQIDVMPDGTAGPTFGLSARFQVPAIDDGRQAFDPDGSAGELMSHIEERGLSDERWRSVIDTAFATRVSKGENAVAVYCYPTFIKLRWRDGDPLDAKMYLLAYAKEVEAMRETEGGAR